MTAPIASALLLALSLVLSGRADAVESTAMVDLESTIGDAFPIPRDAKVGFSPDGEHLYAASGGIHVYDRDPASGALALVEVESNTTAAALTVSPDGLHLYATRFDTDTVQVFARDTTTGALTFVAGYPAVDAGWVLISGDGAHVYVVRESSQILVYARDPVAGTLTAIETEAATAASIVSAALSSDGRHLYVSRDRTSVDDDVFVYARDAATGLLTPEPSLAVTTPFVRQLALDPDAAHVYVLQRSGVEEVLKVYERDAGTGGLTLVESEVLVLHGSTFTIEVSSDGDHLYVGPAETATSHFAVLVYEREASGAITLAEEFATQVESGGIVLAPDGAHAYADLSPALKIYERDAGTGSLAFLDALVPLRGASGGVLSPDGAHAYLRFDRDWITVAERDPGSGDLTPIQTLFERHEGVSGLKGANDLAISADGAHLYAVSEDDGALSAFSRDPSSGELTFVEVLRNGSGGTSGLLEPTVVTVSRDDSFVYTGSRDGNGIAVFARDPITGALGFVESHDVTDVEGIASCPGTGDVYVTGRPAGLGAGVHAYSRDPLTGALQYEASYDATEGGFGYPGFKVNGAVLCSADGEYVYATGAGFFPEPAPLAVAVYARDSATGALDHVQLVRQGSGGVFALSGALAISVDGHYVYTENPLSVFRRDVESGEIALVDVAGASYPSRSEVLASPDGRVYRLSGEAPGIEVFERGFACAPTPASGCRDGEAAKIDVGDSILDQRDKVTFSLTKGDATSAAEFDPGTSNHFALCFYDESGPPELVFAAIAPANEDCRPSLEASPKPCWRTGTVSKLKDPYATPDGVRDLQLKSGVHEKVAIKASVLGANVRGPELPLGLPLRAQLQSAAGLCWEAVFPSASRNDAGRFKAKVAN